MKKKKNQPNAQPNTPAIIAVVVFLMASGIAVQYAVLQSYAPPVTPETATTMTESSSVALARGAVSSSSPETKKKSVCVSKSADLPELLRKAETVNIMMPAKAAGQALEMFARRCTGVPEGTKPGLRGPSNTWRSFLLESYEKKPVVVQHVLRPSFLTDIALHASSRNLLLWIHREETSRLISAIRQVVKVACKNLPEDNRSYDFEMVERTDDKCTISETDLIERVIEPKLYEVGKGAVQVLGCDQYRAIAENLPNMVFAEYTRANDLMVEIAKRHCPSLLSELPIYDNVATDYQRELFVKLTGTAAKNGGANGNDNGGGGDDGGGRTVPLDDWLEQKGSHLEMLLNLKEGMTCQGTTRRMENAIESCEDRIVRIDDDWIG